MADLMKIRIHGDGPSARMLRIEDVETGKLLPVIADSFTLTTRDGALALECALIISNVDIEGCISLGVMMDQIAGAQEPESLDDFAERTVSLIIGEDDD